MNHEEDAWIKHLVEEYITDMYRLHPQCRYQYGIMMCSRIHDKIIKNRTEEQKRLEDTYELSVGVLP